ncbi:MULTISPECIES: acetylglutamate kinase [unclassified Jeotgalibaca]|uniref:acetylglutamate kinase n=1 Tax=unclassified Jeotgalibaca TaxID=2621505 RepID=UPI003FD2386B
MIITADERAEILLDSLSYIKKFHNKIVVIKYGGNAMLNDELKASVIKDLVLLKYIGMNPVIVHGGGPEITHYMELKGIETTFIDGLRVTTPETMKIAEMVLTGSISPEITALFNQNGVPSISMSGKDGKSIIAEQRCPELGLVGKVTQVNTQYITNLINEGYVPVISPIAYGEDGSSLNVNSDEVAKHLATALAADKLILLTDVDGVLAEPGDSQSLMSRLTPKQIREGIDTRTITGGMIPKMECCLGAISGGVKRCHIINGTIPHAILLELFTKEGIGTMITNEGDTYEDANC